MTEFQMGSKGAVVTGAGSGIGESLVHALALRGFDVIVADINEENARRVAERAGVKGVQAHAVRVDVGDRKSVIELADFAFERLGAVTFLANNAGVSWRPFRAVWDADIDEIEWMTRINYMGVVYGMSAFIPRMIEQGRPAHIVNTSSLATLSITPGHGPYTASKAAVNGISDVARAELEGLGVPIGVTVLFPGAVTTGIAANSAAIQPESAREQAVKPYPIPPNAALLHNQPIPPDHVGALVLDAVDRHRPYCFTHSAQDAGLEARAAWIEQASGNALKGR